MNIYDISEKAGVSIATVSRVLNGSSHVSEKTHRKVMSVIESENYSPNVFARGLSLNTMHSIGILYCDASDLYLANAVYHLERCFRAKGYVCLLCCCGYEMEERKKYINLMLSKKVDAIVLAGSHFVEGLDEDNGFIRSAAKEVPVAILSGKIVGDNILCAYCDDQAALCEIATRLFDSGSQKVVFSYSVHSDSIRRKICGLKQAYSQQGLPFQPEYVIRCPHLTNMDGYRDYFQTVFQECRFDAIICMDDSLAVAVLKAAQNCHISVPEQLRIVGYNDSVVSRCTSPELSTVDNRTKELCEQLVKMLTDRFAGNSTESIYFLPGKVLFRGST